MSTPFENSQLQLPPFQLAPPANPLNPLPPAAPPSAASTGAGSPAPASLGPPLSPRSAAKAEKLRLYKREWQRQRREKRRARGIQSTEHEKEQIRLRTAKCRAMRKEKEVAMSLLSLNVGSGKKGAAAAAAAAAATAAMNAAAAAAPPPPEHAHRVLPPPGVPPPASMPTGAMPLPPPGAPVPLPLLPPQPSSPTSAKSATPAPGCTQAGQSQASKPFNHRLVNPSAAFKPKSGPARTMSNNEASTSNSSPESTDPAIADPPSTPTGSMGPDASPKPGAATSPTESHSVTTGKGLVRPSSPNVYASYPPPTPNQASLMSTFKISPPLNQAGMMSTFSIHTPSAGRDSASKKRKQSASKASTAPKSKVSVPVEVMDASASSKKGYEPRAGAGMGLTTPTPARSTTGSADASPSILSDIPTLPILTPAFDPRTVLPTLGAAATQALTISDVSAVKDKEACKIIPGTGVFTSRVDGESNKRQRIGVSPSLSASDIAADPSEITQSPALPVAAEVEASKSDPVTVDAERVSAEPSSTGQSGEQTQELLSSDIPNDTGPVPDNGANHTITDEGLSLAADVMKEVQPTLELELELPCEDDVSGLLT
ncbi:hypothetical protein YB2330_000416 [Saitoella coloradoensis]